MATRNAVLHCNKLQILSDRIQVLSVWSKGLCDVNLWKSRSSSKGVFVADWQSSVFRHGGGRIKMSDLPKKKSPGSMRFLFWGHLQCMPKLSHSHSTTCWQEEVRHKSVIFLWCDFFYIFIRLNYYSPLFSVILRPPGGGEPGCEVTFIAACSFKFFIISYALYYFKLLKCQ